MDKPHSHYEHVFAVVRFDDYLSGIEDAITITKVLRKKEDARREAERLNRLNASKGSRYFWKLTRIDSRPNAAKE